MTWITIPTVFGASPWFIADLNADFAAIVNALNTFNPSGAVFNTSTPSVVRGLLGANGGSPNNEYVLSCDFVVLRDPSTGALFGQDTVVNTTNDVLIAGPIIDGRDQAGIFPANSWIHFYWIGNPTAFAVNTISSLTPPPSGPTLPAGYTTWAYAGAVRYDGGSTLISTWMRGAQAYYSSGQSVVNTAATVINTETAVPIADQIPPNSLSVLLTASIIVTNGTGTSGFVLNLRSNSGLDAVTLRSAVTSVAGGWGQMHAELPNVAQNYFYLWDVDSPSSPALTETQQWVNGYRIANGDA